MKTLDHMDWRLLREQKLRLVQMAERASDQAEVDCLEGIIVLLDALQDEAADLGYPVVWSSDDALVGKHPL